MSDKLEERASKFDVSKKVEDEMKELPRNVGKHGFKNWHRTQRALERTKLKRGLKEDAPANCAGAGAIAGIGVGLKGEPGVPKKRKKDIILDTMKRKPVSEETLYEDKTWHSWHDWNNEYTDLLKKRNKHKKAAEDWKSTPEARERAKKRHEAAEHAVRAHSDHPNRPQSGVMVNRSHSR